MNVVKKYSSNMELKRLLQLFWATEVTLFIILIQRIYLHSWGQALALATAQLVLFIVYFLAKKGSAKIAGNLLLFLITILLLGFIWNYGGLRDEVLLVLPAVIMYSILLGGGKFSAYIYLFICLNVFSIGYLNQYGYMQHTIESGNISTAVLIIILLTLISYAIYLLSSEIRTKNIALKRSKEELEVRVVERTAELQKSLDNLTKTQTQLIESEKMASLGRLVAGIAHEINTPIGIAITTSTYLDGITKEFQSSIEQKSISKNAIVKHNLALKEGSELISSNLQRAALLIQSFKDHSIDQSSDSKRNFNLKNYLNEVLFNLSPEIKNTNIKVELVCEPNIEIYSNPGSLAQVITNLYMNAIQHAFDNSKHGLITIIVTKEKARLSILFIDSGMGIAQENIIHLFEPFYTTRRGSGSRGLGLHIAFNLVTQSLNGTITCSSKIDKGTQFELSFPCFYKEKI